MAQTRKGKKTPGKKKRLPVRILTNAQYKSAQKWFAAKKMRKSVGNILHRSDKIKQSL